MSSHAFRLPERIGPNGNIFTSNNKLTRSYSPALLFSLVVLLFTTSAFVSTTIAPTLAAKLPESLDLDQPKNLFPPPTNVIPGYPIKEDQPPRNPINEESTVLIVGATRGIGLEFVKQCANKGAKVLATHHSSTVPDELKALAEENSRIQPLLMDLDDEDSIVQAAQRVKSSDNFTPITHVINSAGSYPEGRSFDGTARGGNPALPMVTAKDMMDAYITNAVGPFLVAQNFVPLLGQAPNSPKKNLPVYAFLGSELGSITTNYSGGSYAYRPSISALHSICKSLSIDLATEASVVVLDPGDVRTNLSKGSGVMDPPESVEGMLRAIEATDATVGFRFVDNAANILPW